MLKLRPDQLQAFEQDLTASFHSRMLVHLRRMFPKRTAAYNEDQLRILVDGGRQRAGRYGLVSERDVCKYIDLMIVFGPAFDREQPWAAEILQRHPCEPSLKMRDLIAAATEQEHRLIG